MKAQIKNARIAWDAMEALKNDTARDRKIWSDAGMGVIGPHAFAREWADYYKSEAALNSTLKQAVADAIRVATSRELFALGRYMGLTRFDVPPPEGGGIRFMIYAAVGK